MNSRSSPRSRAQLHWHRPRLPKTTSSSRPATPPLNPSLNIQATPNAPPPVYTPSSHPPGYADIHLTPLASTRPSTTATPTLSTNTISRLSLAATSHTATLSETSVHSYNATTGAESLRQGAIAVETPSKENTTSLFEIILRTLHRWRWWILVVVFLALFIVAMVWWILSSSIGVAYRTGHV
ncbi:hypothetical protein VI817_003350 [Penicillium citrinum]|uniref:Uncharacterized protein n=1 Tax=Penicillium hetheringtonii TaxID=911720 RepID=A0AAD6DP33_9EURO|nr:hypothetical protein N7450_003918 [Penicillium hetheringtonii]KAK5801138.1 hypothetical protein VI817_003350 [Penicillium citrinum]